MTLAIKTQAAAKPVVPRIDITSMPRLDPALAQQTALMRTLQRALTTKRGADGQGEAAFVAWLCNRLPVSMVDGAGNIHVDLRGSNTRTLFTAHTDSVHHSEGVNAVRIDTTQARQVLWRADGAALGADDGCGVALMVHMIEASVPGYYVFFRSEECGGVGSKHLADNMPSLLKQFDRAIAFDRAGYYDVITHQAGGRCASDAFADALADSLNTANADFFYCSDSTGVYTDTAEFIDLIPECTNLSVGYRDQHGDREYTDVTFLQQLADAVLLVDWEALPTERKPQAKTYAKYAIPTVGGKSDEMWDYGAITEPDPAADEVVDALALAIDGYSRALVDMMCDTAAYLYGMTPLEAQNYIRAGRLTVEVLDASMNDVLDGGEPDLILSDLYDYCCH